MGPQMPWKTAEKMSLRHEFIELASKADANVSELCRRFEISRKNGYKWIARFKQRGAEGLLDQSRRPHGSPARTEEEVTRRVLQLRQQHPTRGGRKLRSMLLAQGHTEVPSASTVSDILRRHGLISALQSEQHTAFKRFERSQPNELWQMDFKGHFALRVGRCHPLTVLDDHSRYLVGLVACADEQSLTVEAILTQLFQRYGLPQAILCDNGSPWGCSGREDGCTQLQTWLMRLDVKMYHGRAYHPQTQGKVERFHRTLNCDLIAQGGWRDLPHCQARFDPFRHEYNTLRPHESLDDRPPISAYLPSSRSMPSTLPPIEYDSLDTVRVVKTNGTIMWANRTFVIGKPLQRLPIGIRPLSEQLFAVRFRGHVLGLINLSNPLKTNKHAYLPLQPVPPSKP